MESALFITCYADIPEFLAVSGDGVVRNHEELKKICKDYYGNLKEQKLTTVREYYLVLDGSSLPPEIFKPGEPKLK